MTNRILDKIAEIVIELYFRTRSGKKLLAQVAYVLRIDDPEWR